MSDDIRQEVDALKRTLASCADRIGMLEQRLRTGSTIKVFAPPPAVVPTVKASPVAAVSAAAPRWRNLEATIGRDWLNRIGVVTLVLGIVFFILYTFQYLGPAMKIAMGFAIGGGLLGAGMWLERRPGMRWYALGPIGGGWALVYFTVYAMHHIPAVRLLDSALVDLCLLGAVATGAVWHSLKYKSETVTALALLLGFITVAVGQVTAFTLLAIVLLVAALCWLVIRMRWHYLYLFGVAASYATYLFWIRPQIDASQAVAGMFANVAQAQFWLKAGFLMLYWSAYQVALFGLDESRPVRRHVLLAATLANALGFAQLVLLTMDPLYHDVRYLFLLAMGGAYILSAPLAQQRRLPTIETTHLLLGLTMAAVAVPLKLTGQWVSIWWTLAVPFFIWLGLRYTRRAYRAFAAGLAAAVLVRWVVWDVWNASAVVFPSWFVTWRVAIGSIVTASFVTAAWCYRRPRYQPVLWRFESQGFRVYVAAAACVLWFLLGQELDNRWLLPAWMGTSAGLVVLGLRLHDRIVRLFGAIGGALTVLITASLMSARIGINLHHPWYAWTTAITLALCAALSWRYRAPIAGPRFAFERWLRDAYAIAAAALLIGLLWTELHRQWVSVAWAVEGATVLALGFAARDRVLRYIGLAVFGLMVLKILFVDLAGVETIYRILSFIVAGLVLLVASYAYTRFSSRLAPSTPTSET